MFFVHIHVGLYNNHLWHFLHHVPISPIVVPYWHTVVNLVVGIAAYCNRHLLHFHIDPKYLSHSLEE